MNYKKSTFELSDIALYQLERLLVDMHKHDMNIKRRALVEMAISELYAEHYRDDLDKETQEIQLKRLAELLRDFYSK
jgi:hypothetical protein